MDIKIVYRQSEDGCAGHYSLSVDDKERIGIMADPECPEDFTLYRNLSDLHEVEKLLAEAYAAGVAGDDFAISVFHETDEDD